jgi:hypothetical protein
MTAEREVVLGLQPAMVGAAEFSERSEFNHGISPSLNLRWALDMRFPMVHK